jgi:hypothetical protein
MEIALPELLDRISIVKLKIENAFEPQLIREYDEYLNAIKKIESDGVLVKKEWYEKLNEINKKSWDLEWDVRNLACHEEIWKRAENEIGFEELGRRALEVGKLMSERAKVKNQIAKESKSNFNEEKIDHVGDL